MAHVFISYVRDNAADVDRLCAALIASGAKVWLDRNDISPGARWRDAIRDAIRSGDYFIACFSSEYQGRDKTYMNEELTLAIEELRQFPTDRAWFIPVLLSECDVPSRAIGAGETLLDINWVPLYADWEGGIRRILSVINPIPAETQRRIEALHSEDTEIRRYAARALGDDTHPSAIAELRKTLVDSDNSVQEEAIDSVLRYGDQGVNALVDVVTTTAGESPKQLIEALLHRVEVQQSEVAATALSAIYRSADDQQRAVIKESIARIKDYYIDDYDTKMRERALQALQDLVQQLDDTKVG
jgi:hypothetical protein